MKRCKVEVIVARAEARDLVARSCAKTRTTDQPWRLATACSSLAYGY
jgi:hypothetical protein